MEKSKTKEVILHEIKLEENSHAITSSAYALTDNAITKAMQIFADQETAKLKERNEKLDAELALSKAEYQGLLEISEIYRENWHSSSEDSKKLKEQIDFLNKANLFLMDELKEAKELLYKWKHGTDLTITERTDNFLNNPK